MRRHHLLLLAAALAMVTPTVARAAADPARPQQWNLEQVGAPAAWATATGEGMVVAVVDSGVDLGHEDLAGRLVAGYDFVDDDDDPQDENGHGTHVAGIVAAAMGNGRGIAGVAPDAKVMPIRVLGPDGGGSLDDVVAGVRFAVANGAHVLNLSLGEDTQAILGPTFADVLEEAWAAGVVPVVSAGNQFVTGSGFSDEDALVVAATDRHDGKPSYSSGVGRAKWGISAPGGELPTLRASDAVLSSYWTGDEPHQYAYLAGTSQAAPHVSAAVAVLLSTGRFTPDQAVQRLLQTAEDIGAAGRDSTFGVGRLDLTAAVRGLRPAPPASRPPTASGGAAAPAPTTTRPGTAPTTTTTQVAGMPPAEMAVLTTTTILPVASETVPREAEGRRPAILDPPAGDADDRTLPAMLAGALALGVAASAAGLRRRQTATTARPQ